MRQARPPQGVPANDKQSKQVKPDKAGKYTGQEMNSDGSRKKDTRTVHITPLEAEVMPLFLLALESGVPRCDYVLFNTCTARSACPPSFAPSVPAREIDELPLTQADGSRVAHDGAKTIRLATTSGGASLEVQGAFDVKGVTRPMMVVGSIVDSGYGVCVAPPRRVVRRAREAGRAARCSGGERSWRRCHQVEEGAWGLRHAG